MNFPVGYGYALFKVSSPILNKYVIACSKNHAKELAALKNSKVAPVFISNLIKEYGHQKTASFFKYFGERWMTKDGCVFFPHDNKKGTYIEYNDNSH